MKDLRRLILETFDFNQLLHPGDEDFKAEIKDHLVNHHFHALKYRSFRDMGNTENNDHAAKHQYAKALAHKEVSISHLASAQSLFYKLHDNGSVNQREWDNMTNDAHRDAQRAFDNEWKDPKPPHNQ